MTSQPSPYPSTFASAHKVRRHGDLLAIYTWVNDARALVLLPAPIAVITLLKKTGTKARLQIRAPGAIEIHKHSEPQVV